jgi:hypothetical protein
VGLLIIIPAAVCYTGSNTLGQRVYDVGACTGQLNALKMNYNARYGQYEITLSVWVKSCEYVQI